MQPMQGVEISLKRNRDWNCIYSCRGRGICVIIFKHLIDDEVDECLGGTM